MKQDDSKAAIPDNPDRAITEPLATCTRDQIKASIRERFLGRNDAVVDAVADFYEPLLMRRWEPTDQMRSIVDKHHADTDGLLRALHSAGLLAADIDRSLPDNGRPVTPPESSDSGRSQP